MAKMIFDLDDKKDKEFRDTIIKVKGFHKGVIKESLEEAIDAWIEEQAQRMAKGIKKGQTIIPTGQVEVDPSVILQTLPHAPSIVDNTCVLLGICHDSQYVIDALDRESNDHAEDLEYIEELLNTQRESLSSTDMNISVLVPVVVELAKRLNALESVQKTEQRTKHMREGFERFVKERAQKIEREKQQGEERIKRGFPGVK